MSLRPRPGKTICFCRERALKPCSSWREFGRVYSSKNIKCAKIIFCHFSDTNIWAPYKIFVLWENHGKTTGEPLENHMRTRENHRRTTGEYGKTTGERRKTTGEPRGLNLERLIGTVCILRRLRTVLLASCDALLVCCAYCLVR